MGNAISEASGALLMQIGITCRDLISISPNCIPHPCSLSLESTSTTEGHRQGPEGIMGEPSPPPSLTALRSASAPSLSRLPSRKEAADDSWASGLTLDNGGMPSPKCVMAFLEGVELTTLNLDENIEAVAASEDVPATISAQLELLTSSECNVVQAATTLTEMIQRDHAVQEAIRIAGGIRSAVFLLKLGQAAGNPRIVKAASRLLVHLARGNARNQDKIAPSNPKPVTVSLASALISSLTPT